MSKNESSKTESTKVKKKLGRPPGIRTKESEARSAFELVRIKLKLTKKLWCAILECDYLLLAKIEIGRSIPSVAVAKRMQIEAWSRGLPITLDELYQSVAPYEHHYLGDSYKGGFIHLRKKKSNKETNDESEETKHQESSEEEDE